MCCDLCLRLSDYNIDNENNIVCGRTMEFAEPLKSKLCVIPRNKHLSSVTPSCNFEWTSTLGFVGINILDTNIIVDGMNEVGLSCGLLVMDDTKYYPVTGRSIAISDICSYILSTCSNVNEAINILSNIDIYGSVIPVINRLLGLHIVVHDAYGMSIVCQLTDKRNIYYTNGVVTNGPDYPSQLSILNSNNKSFSTWSSVGRFIKLTELKHLCLPESYDGIGLVQLICHIFNNVDIIRGVSASTRDHGIIYSNTQWMIIKDLTEKILYYRSYNNMTLRRLDLNKIDFSSSKLYSEIPIDDMTPSIIDIN